MESAKVILVIETKTVCGARTENDPMRVVTRYWDPNGKLLAEADSTKLQEDNTFNFVPTVSMEQLIQLLREKSQRYCADSPKVPEDK